jgi:hypothetical protein
MMVKEERDERRIVSTHQDNSPVMNLWMNWIPKRWPVVIEFGEIQTKSLGNEWRKEAVGCFLLFGLACVRGRARVSPIDPQLGLGRLRKKLRGGVWAGMELGSGWVTGSVLGSEVRKWGMTWVLMLRLLTESVLNIAMPVMWDAIGDVGR